MILMLMLLLLFLLLLLVLVIDYRVTCSWAKLALMERRHVSHQARMPALGH